MYVQYGIVKPISFYPKTRICPPDTHTRTITNMSHITFSRLNLSSQSGLMGLAWKFAREEGFFEGWVRRSEADGCMGLVQYVQVQSFPLSWHYCLYCASNLGYRETTHVRYTDNVQYCTQRLGACLDYAIQPSDGVTKYDRFFFLSFFLKKSSPNLSPFVHDITWFRRTV